MKTFAPAIVWSALALLLPLPAAALIGLFGFALHLVAASHQLQFLPDEALLETLRARGGAFVLAMLLGLTLAALTVGPPLAWMVHEPNVFTPVAVALGALVCALLLLRLWALPGLLFVWEDARQGSGESAWLVLRRTLKLAWVMGARLGDALALGSVSVVLVLAVALAPWLLVLVGQNLWLKGALALGYALLCAAMSVSVLKLAARALFEPQADRSPAEPLIAPEPEPVHAEPLVDAPADIEEAVPTLAVADALKLPDDAAPQAPAEAPAPQIVDERAPVASAQALAPTSAPNLLALIDDSGRFTAALIEHSYPADALSQAAQLAASRDRVELLAPLSRAGWRAHQLSADGESLIERALRSASGATIKALLNDVLVGVDLDSGREPALVAALEAKRHDLPNIVRQLVKAGADPQRPGSHGASAVTLAIKRDASELLPFLLRSGARAPAPVSRRATPVSASSSADASELIGIAQRGDVNRLGEVLRALPPGTLRATEGTTALIHAAGRGHRTIVEQLIDGGALPTAQLPNGSCAFSAAALAGHADVVGLLMRLGVGVDTPLAGHATALILAASRWRYATVTNLLRAGANPNHLSQGDFSALAAGAQYLHGARALTGGKETLQALIKAGANVSHVNADGHTPVLLLLGAASESGDPVASREPAIVELLKVLLNAGAGVAQIDLRGRTAMHWCARHGLIDCAAQLLKAKASLRIADASGCYPIDIAHQAQQTAFVAWLVQQGADH